MSAIAKEYGMFFNSNNNDRTYSADSFETWLKPFFVTGVFNGGLQVTAQSEPDMTVNVSAGYANLNGKTAYWDEDNTMTLETASGVYNRIDTIVLRRDNTNRVISIEVVTGVASANPQPTPPVRNGDIYELVLAQIVVGVGVTEITPAKITDTRMIRSLCGYVAATVEEIDFEQIKNQFDAWAAEYQEETEEDFTDWFNAIKGQLSEDAAGHLQLEIDAIQDQVDRLGRPLLLHGNMTGYNTLTSVTITNPNITATMIPHIEFQKDNVFIEDGVIITVIDGSVTVSGRINGTTTFDIILQEMD